MNLFELFMIALGVSMDAFAAAICKGLSLKRASVRHAGIVGLYFGTFQAVMPVIGYFLGAQFSQHITAYDHWFAFILLGAIGFNMVKESKNNTCDIVDVEVKKLSFKNMIILAIATSIDALAVGITFAFLNINILPAVIFIGMITFTTSFIGVKIGNIFGVRCKSKAELAGGIILIAMGTKILLEHLGIINF